MIKKNFIFIKIQNFEIFFVKFIQNLVRIRNFKSLCIVYIRYYNCMIIFGLGQGKILLRMGKGDSGLIEKRNYIVVNKDKYMYQY